MKDSKQLLFERMQILNPDFKPINEGKLYVKHTEIPRQILDWAKSILGRGFENKITIEKADGKVTIGLPWHDADRETHQFFKLVNGGAQATGNPVSKTGWSEAAPMDDPYGTVEIPSGFILASAGTYPKRLELTVGDDALDMIADNSEVLDHIDRSSHQRYIRN